MALSSEGGDWDLQLTAVLLLFLPIVEVTLFETVFVVDAATTAAAIVVVDEAEPDEILAVDTPTRLLGADSLVPFISLQSKTPPRISIITCRFSSPQFMTSGRVNNGNQLF